MPPENHLSAVAALIGDPTRAAVLSILLGGQSFPAGELARRAYVTPQTMSQHLGKLLEGGLLKVNQTGRHRYYGLKNADVASTLESLALLAVPPKSREAAEDQRPLFFARTCYDHLAGKLGVMLMQAMTGACLVATDGEMVMLTMTGSAWLKTWQIDETELRKSRRKFACACIDWSERREHLAGALGAAITTQMFARGWLSRLPDGRAVRLTADGRAGFKREFGILAAG